MKEMQYQNYYRAYRGEELTEDNSLLFRLKKGMLDAYERATKGFSSFVRRMGNKNFNHKLLDRRIPKLYKAAAKAPVDENKIVFVEIRHPHITNSFEVIFDELVNNYDYTIHTHFLLNASVIRAEYAKRVYNAVEDIATAKYVFLNEGSNAISAIPLRPETKVIQLWHGCGAFKKFGFSTADLIFGADRKEQLRHPFNKNYSLVTVSSPEIVWAYKEAMNLPEDTDVVQPVGSSRTDIFFKQEFIDNAYKTIYDKIPQAQGKKIILYAPTFRGRVAKAETPDRLNVGMFYEAFKDDYVLLIKHHPVVKNRPIIDNFYREFAFDVTDSLSIEDLICTSDFCISDYSSLIFEYSLFEKPLILFAYDLDEYFDWRGFYYEYNEYAPGPICKTNFEMIDYIKNIDERFDKQAVKDFRDKFMSACDGHATQRILEYAFDNLEAHRKPCEKFEHFYDVPKVESSLMPYFRMVEMIKEEKVYAEELYNKYSSQPIESGRIIAFDIHSPEVKYLLQHAKNINMDVISPGDDFDSVISRIATAQYILIDQANALLDSIKIRPETNVILLPADAFPLAKFGVNTKEFRSGLRKEQYEIAPLYSSVNSVVCASEASAKIFTSAIGENIKPIIVGDVKSDIFYKTKYREKLLERLYETCPNIEGKKIICYIGKDDHGLDDSMIYEYLSRDYVFLKHYEAVDETLLDEEELALNYASDSVIDVSLIMSVYELMIVSDIIVGGLFSSVYSAMASGKPVIIYNSGSSSDISSFESFIDVKENSPTAVCSDINSVISIIRNIENYDYTVYNNIRNKYLEKCDGKSTKRLQKLLKNSV